MSLMTTFDTLSDADKAIVHEMSDAARDAMRASGTDPTNDDRVAIFDEACAVYLVDSRKGYPGRPPSARVIANQNRQTEHTAKVREASMRTGVAADPVLMPRVYPHVTVEGSRYERREDGRIWQVSGGAAFRLDADALDTAPASVRELAETEQARSARIRRERGLPPAICN